MDGYDEKDHGFCVLQFLFLRALRKNIEKLIMEGIRKDMEGISKDTHAIAVARALLATGVTLLNSLQQEEMELINEEEGETGMIHFEAYMLQTYGCTKPYENQLFPNSKTAAAFIRDYCLLKQKKEWQISGSGTNVEFHCAYNKHKPHGGSCSFCIKVSTCVLYYLFICSKLTFIKGCNQQAFKGS